MKSLKLHRFHGKCRDDKGDKNDKGYPSSPKSSEPASSSDATTDAALARILQDLAESLLVYTMGDAMRFELENIYLNFCLVTSYAMST